MKKLLFPLFAIATVVVMAACSPMDGRSTDPELAAAVKSTLRSRDFTIFFDRVTTHQSLRNRHPRARGGSVSLSGFHHIRISGNFISSNIPYFGDPWIFGRRNGLVFDSPITNYRMSKGRAGAINIRFNTQTFTDRYEFMITVFPNGRVNMVIFPNRRSSVTFDGWLRFNR